MAGRTQISLSIYSLLRDTAGDLLHVNRVQTVDVTDATVGSFLNEFLSEQVEKNIAVMPGQPLYLILARASVVVYAHNSSFKLRHLGLCSNDTVQITPEYMSYTSAVAHQIFKLPRPLISRKIFLVYPEEMGYEYMEDVHVWLSSVGCASYKIQGGAER